MSRILMCIIASDLLAFIISNQFPIDFLFMLNNISRPNATCAEEGLNMEWYDARIFHATELRTSTQGSI